MDLSQYIGFFVDEGRQHLEQCSALLVQLEQSPQDQNTLFEIFRLIHTLKGMAATLVEFPYFQTLTDLSHEMEDLLDDVRNEVFPVNGQVIDLLFALTDALIILVNKVSDPNESGPVTFDYLHQHILEFRSLGKISAAEHEFNINGITEIFAPEDCQELVDALKAGIECAKLEVNLDPTCLMPNVRALLVLRNLEEVSEILTTSPNYELIEKGSFDHKFEVIVKYSCEFDLLQEAVMATTEIDTVFAEKIELKLEANLKPLQLKHPDIPGLNEFEERLVQEAHRQGLNSVLLALRLNPLDMLSIPQITQIFRLMEQKGEIIKSLPSVYELEEGKYQDFLAFVIITDENAQNLEKVIMDTTIQNKVQVSATLVEPPRSGNVKAKATPPKEVPSNNKASHVLRVDAKKLDRLAQLTNELVLSRTCLFQLLASSQDPALRDTLNHMSSIITSLQVLGLQLKLVPLDQVFKRFHRVVRDLSKQLNKDIELVIEGGDVALERTLVEELMPLMIHLIRNACDHGIENTQQRKDAEKPEGGSIRIIAQYSTDLVYIRVKDDGKGIDAERLKTKALSKGLIDAETELSPEDAVNLIFIPGLSTQEDVTDISGRGVGMDAVKQQIQVLNGDISVSTELGVGTEMILTFPQQHKIEKVVLFTVNKDLYTLPVGQIQKVSNITQAQTQDISTVKPAIQNLLDLREQLIPLNLNHQEHNAWEERPLIVLKTGHGLIIDEIIGEDTLLINRMGTAYKDAEHISGASILESGDIALHLSLDLILPPL